jgi:hypothetical protein
VKHRPLHSGRCGTRGNVRVSTHPPRGGGGIAGPRRPFVGPRISFAPLGRRTEKSIGPFFLIRFPRVPRRAAARQRPRYSTRGSPYAPFGAEAMYATGAWEPARGGAGKALCAAQQWEESRNSFGIEKKSVTSLSLRERFSALTCPREPVN